MPSRNLTQLNKLEARIEQLKRARAVKAKPLDLTLPPPQPGAQTQFYESNADITIAGGSAGGGKSFGLLLRAAKWLAVPNYGAVIFRKSYPEIRMEGGLWDESMKLYSKISGSESRESFLDWSFPWRSSVSFGHADRLKERYPGAQIAYIGVDQLETWSESDFWFLLSRNRSTCGVTPKLDATCNPDADSFLATLLEWWINQETGYPIEERSGVVRYFYRISEVMHWGDSAEELMSRFPDMAEIAPPKSLTFIAASVHQNKELLRVNPQYLSNLLSLHPVETERLLRGNWKVRYESGNIFKRSWFEVVDYVPPGGLTVRFWDLAATSQEFATKQSYYTACQKWRKVGNVLYILDVGWWQLGASEGDRLIQSTATQDGKLCKARWELEGGSAALRHEAGMRQALSGFDARGERPMGDKLKRALLWAGWASQGKIKVLRAPWNDQFFSAIERFDGSRVPLISDVVDAGSGAAACLQGGNGGTAIVGGELRSWGGFNWERGENVY